MSKKILVILAGLFLLIGLMAVNAVAPHPDYLKEVIKRGDGPMMTQKLDTMQKIGMDSAQKSFPTSGNRKVLVILIDFPDTTTAMIEKKDSPLKYASLGILSIIILGAVITVIFGRKKNITGIIIPVLIVLVLPTFITVSSCFIFETSDSSGSSEDEETYPAEALSFNAVSTTTFYEELLNGTSSTDLSMKKYYSDMSNGDLTLDLTAVGPYTAKYSYKYYGTNVGDYDRKPGTLVGEAIDAAEADGVNFADYANGESSISVIVIHAGRGEETGAGSDYIWSHRWTLSSAQAYGDGSGTRTYDGITIDDYSLQSEYIYVAGDTQVGLFCHEFGHILGLPDLYDIYSLTDGVGDWSLMASGSWNGTNGSHPAPLIAWERDYLGWITVTDVTSGSHTVTDTLDSTPEALKIDSGYSYTYNSTAYDQYYLAENIYNDSGTDNWVDGLPGSGLLITLIDEYIINGVPITGGPGTFTSNKVNSLYTSGPSAWCHGVTVIERDANDELWSYGGLQGNSTDLFYSYTGPYSLYRNNYTSSTSGTPLGSDTGIDISNVGSTGSSINFTF